jgi:hypothetical protein
MTNAADKIGPQEYLGDTIKFRTISFVVFQFKSVDIKVKQIYLGQKADHGLTDS